MNNQDVYAAILTFKVFRTLVALMAAFKFETKQLNAVNAFLNAHNDEAVYCYLPDGYKQPRKVMKVLKALYDQRKSPLLWLKTLCMKCMKLEFYQISDEPCLFTDRDGIFLFFYVDDIVFAYRLDRSKKVKELITQFKKWFEIKNMGQLIYFLKIQVIRNVDEGIILLMQNVYINKLIKEYEIIAKKKIAIPFSYDQELISYENEVDPVLMNSYKKKIESICYSAIMIKSDIAKTIFKLIEHLKSSEPDHIKTTNHCLRYLNATKHLKIRYFVEKRFNLTVRTSKKEKILKATADASYAIESDRRSDENYIFKLFDGLID